jgi:hypothetical protein
VVTVLHILTVGFEDLGVGSGLEENLAQHREIETERRAESEALGEGRGVDVHDHVDERLYLRGLSGRTDVAKGRAELIENRFHPVEGGAVAAAHQVKRAVAGLRESRRPCSLRA